MVRWAGEFKSYKTTSLLDFVLSVASGMDFLGQFPVKDPGCALYLHEEGRMNEIQELFRGIAARKGLAPKVSVNEGKRSIKFADKGVEDLLSVDHVVCWVEPLRRRIKGTAPESCGALQA